MSLNPVPELGTTNNPVKLGADHFIAPICGTCRREIDKDAHGQWRHVGAQGDMTNPFTPPAVPLAEQPEPEPLHCGYCSLPLEGVVEVPAPPTLSDTIQVCRYCWSPNLTGARHGQLVPDGPESADYVCIWPCGHTVAERHDACEACTPDPWTAPPTEPVRSNDLDVILREAGIEYPLGLLGVRDLVMQRNGHRQRAEEAEKELADLHRRIRPIGRELRRYGRRVSAARGLEALLPSEQEGGE